ncbi:MAG: universal stress protein [Halobacterium sp.]
MTFKNVLVSTDGSACASGATAHGVALARAFEGRIRAVSAIDPTRFGGSAAGDPSDLVERQTAMARRRAEEALADVADRAAAAGVPAETVVVEGHPHDALDEQIREMGADLVTMGTHGRTGLDHYLIGSVAERTVRTSPAPVLVVHGDEDGLPDYDDVVVPTDGSAHAARAADLAVAVAGAFGATLHALHVGDADLTGEVVARADAAGVPNEAVVRQGNPGRTIVAYADEVDADLVAMGTHGRTGLDRRLVGSVAERTVRRATHPVLTVHASESNGSV